MNNFQKGLTLVELLVVVGILSIVSVIILTIFQRTLQGNNRSLILSSLKQNGQSVLEAMTVSVRNSSNILCPQVSSDTLVVEQDRIYTRYRFVLEKTGINGLVQQDNPQKEIDPATGKKETDTVFINRICIPDYPIPSPVFLTDTDPQKGVSVKSGQFTRTRTAGFKDIIKINFTLSQSVSAPLLTASVDPVIFETTIQLR